jgi:5-methylcytosine-specific restriction endonuclease McrA
MKQDWICTWCLLALPDDLSGTHVDHVYPRALWKLGEEFEDEWNLECLHGSCNESKKDKLTDRAAVLILEYA